MIQPSELLNLQTVDDGEYTPGHCWYYLTNPPIQVCDIEQANFDNWEPSGWDKIRKCKDAKRKSSLISELLKQVKDKLAERIERYKELLNPLRKYEGYDYEHKNHWDRKITIGMNLPL